MSAGESLEEYVGPDCFWQGVSYLHGEPDTGLVVIRGLLDTDQVQKIWEAGTEDRKVLTDAGDPNMPSPFLTRQALNKCIVANGIMLSKLTNQNLSYWQQSPELTAARPDQIQLTPFGEGATPHVDWFHSWRPIGVGLSLSIGRARFGASLPDTELRTKAGDPGGELYKEYRESTGHTITHSAELEPGDAALWLQPGPHTSDTNDQNRFAGLFFTLLDL